MHFSPPKAHKREILPSILCIYTGVSHRKRYTMEVVTIISLEWIVTFCWQLQMEGKWTNTPRIHFSRKDYFSSPKVSTNFQYSATHWGPSVQTCEPVWGTFHTQTTQLCQDLSCLGPCIQDCVILLLPHSVPDMMMSFLLKVLTLKLLAFHVASSCSTPPVPLFHLSYCFLSPPDCPPES